MPKIPLRLLGINLGIGSLGAKRYGSIANIAAAFRSFPSYIVSRHRSSPLARAMSTYSGSAGKTAHFKIEKHSIPGSHIREYPRALAEGQEDVVKLAIKQYTPLKPGKHDANGVTIIGAHANGFPKELYEPLWDDLYERLQSKGVHISSIFIADVAHQGDSGVLNEDILGNDPSWFDHPRDLFLMINHFREHMKRPLIGIGHSMGGNNLVNLALMHPRLLTTLILIDPVIQRHPSVGGNFGPARASTKRRDHWPNKKEAVAKFKKSPFYQAWDPRVLDKWVEHGLRELPTSLYSKPQTASNTLPTISADPVTASITPDPETERGLTLNTTKYQEVFTFLRPNFSTAEYPNPEEESNPLTHPDVPDWTKPVTPFYRPEPLWTFQRLPNLRPSVFYIFGDKSDLSEPLLRADKLAETGKGYGGSGGMKKGRVSSHTFKDVGHLIPMEVTRETADVATEWIVPELQRWRTLEAQEKAEWSKVPKREKQQFSKEFVETMMGDWVNNGSSGPSKL